MKIRCEKTRHIVKSFWCHTSRDRLSAEQIMVYFIAFYFPYLWNGLFFMLLLCSRSLKPFFQISQSRNIALDVLLPEALFGVVLCSWRVIEDVMFCVLFTSCHIMLMTICCVWLLNSAAECVVQMNLSQLHVHSSAKQKRSCWSNHNVLKLIHTISFKITSLLPLWQIASMVVSLNSLQVVNLLLLTQVCQRFFWTICR